MDHLVKVTIEVPECYAEAVRWELHRRGKAADRGQVARVLRYCVTHAADYDWWRTIGRTMWLRGDPADVDPYRVPTRGPGQHGEEEPGV
jgi:hypothetical protein